MRLTVKSCNSKLSIRRLSKKEKDKASREHLHKLGQELAELREKSKALTTCWQTEKQAIGELHGLKEKLEQTRRNGTC